MSRRHRSLLMLVSSMVIYGTIGIFRRLIPVSSGVLACSRGIIGALFLLVLLRIRGRKLRWNMGGRTAGLLALSGAVMGFNWILLFEAYHYTSVATATLCYYMQPVIVILASAVLFRERLTGWRLICAAAAVLGMVLVSGVPEQGMSGAGELRGILLGLGAAVLYAAVVLINKSVSGPGAYEKTIIQLLSAAAVMVPYMAAVERPAVQSLTAGAVILLLIVGVVHTGIAYALYFGSMDDLPAQTVALLGYIDPATAILLSLVVLREPMTALSALGAVLILGATLAGELVNPDLKQKNSG